MRQKRIALSFTLLLLTLTTFGAVYQAQGAAATGAKIELSSDSYLVGSPVTIRVYDVVAAGASFNVYFTYDLTGTDTLETKSDFANISVKLGSDEDEWVRTMNFPAPTAGAYVGVHVCGSASGATTDLAADYIYKQTFSGIWPQDLITEIGISLMVVLIMVGIVVGLAYVGASKLRGG